MYIYIYLYVYILIVCVGSSSSSEEVVGFPRQELPYTYLGVYYPGFAPDLKDLGRPDSDLLT